MIYKANKTYCGSPAEEHTSKKEKEFIAINEIYGPTIQGEGKSIGREVKFLRTAGCNLACIWCDTPFTWNWKGTKFQHPDKYEPKKEVHQMSKEEIISELDKLGDKVRSLVISGGEPLLQQKKLLPLLRDLKEEGYWVEIETNGTIIPSDEFIELIDQINCSPKLSNSGIDNPLNKREKPEALLKLAQCEKVHFKFVVSKIDDLEEIFHLVETYQMKSVFLMPEGKTKKEQEEKMNLVEEISKQYGFEFSPRLQVLKWGNRRKV